MEKITYTIKHLALLAGQEIIIPKSVHTYIKRFIERVKHHNSMAMITHEHLAFNPKVMCYADAYWQLPTTEVHLEEELLEYIFFLSCDIWMAHLAAGSTKEQRTPYEEIHHAIRTVAIKAENDLDPKISMIELQRHIHADLQAIDELLAPKHKLRTQLADLQHQITKKGFKKTEHAYTSIKTYGGSKGLWILELQTKEGESKKITVDKTTIHADTYTASYDKKQKLLRIEKLVSGYAMVGLIV